MLFKVKNKTYTVRIDDYTYQKLLLLCDKLDMSMSQLTRKALVQFLSNFEQ